MPFTGDGGMCGHIQQGFARNQMDLCDLRGGCGGFVYDIQTSLSLHVGREGLEQNGELT